MAKFKNMKKLSIVIALIYILAIIGWCRCAYKFISCDFDKTKSWKAEIVYGVGTFTGLGAVIGYIDFGE